MEVCALAALSEDNFVMSNMRVESERRKAQVVTMMKMKIYVAWRGRRLP